MNVNKETFQFHYGLICTKEVDDMMVCEWFQFHYGLICTINKDCLPITVFKFQFHYGLICTVKEAIMNVVDILVSIPLWSNLYC